MSGIYTQFLHHSARFDEALEDGGTYLRLYDRYGGSRDDLESAIDCFEYAISRINDAIKACKEKANA